MRDCKAILTGTSVTPRGETDVLFRAADSRAEWSGLLQDSIRFVEEKHMRNPAMWSIFVRQFRLFSDSVNNGWRGEYWGKMLRGAVEIYRVTQNEELYTCMTDTVRDMLASQDEYGRFSTYERYNELGDWDIWCRKYVMLGFLYYHDVCRDIGLKETIIRALCRHLDALMERVGPGRREITRVGLPKLKGLNSSSILEPVVRLYNVTKEKKYLDYAVYIAESGGVRGENIFREAYKNEKMPYEYSVTKAYEMMSCFEGLLELYRATGTPWFRRAVENFADAIAQTDITVIGGCGCHHEYLDHSAVTQTDPTIRLLKNETCVTVTWIKLCAQLLLLTGNPKYADWIEQSGCNALLGAVNTHACLFDFESVERYHAEFPKNETHNGITDIGMPFDSYSPLLPGVRGAGIGGLKRMQKDVYYGCCASIGGAGIGLLANLCVLYAKEGFAFEMYFPGSARLSTPAGKPVRFEIAGGYPADGKIRITLHMQSPEEFLILLRAPAWSRNPAMAVNTEPCGGAENGYFRVSRLWKDGDVISLALDMRTQLLAQNGFGCLTYGPLVLARDEQFGDDLDVPVRLRCGADGEWQAAVVENRAFRSQLCLELPDESGEPIRFCDYASAGKDWHNGKRMAAWFPIQNVPCKKEKS